MARGPRMRLPRRAPPTSGDEAPPAPSLDLGELESSLEIACLDAIRGDPAGPRLARTLERVCREVLRSTGLDGRIRAHSGPQGTGVEIELPPGPDRVGVVRLSIGSAGGRLR